MRPIFVSYRREDSEGEAGRLFDDLVARFGEDSVFLDVAAIEVGRDFRKAIDESVATCGVLLAIIGKGWLDAKNDAGDRRLDDPSDFVRLETASALKRDIPVIPVLVHGAKMPRADQLPDDLKELAYRNGVELTHARWRSDLELLIKALSPYAVPKVITGKPTPIAPRELEEKDKTAEISPGRGSNSRRAILASVAGAFVLAAGVFWLWPAQRTVPDLTGSTLAEAKLKLETASLAMGSKAYQPDVEKTPDTVLSQAPLPNARVKSGTAVDLVVVKRTLSVEVPILKGRSLADAQKALRDLHLAVGQVTQEPDSHVAANTVLSEFPSAGKQVDPGTAIDLVVAQVQTAPPQGPSRAPKGPAAESAVAQPPKSSASLPAQSPSLPPAGTGKGATGSPQTNGSVPNFAGTWEGFSITSNGVPRSASLIPKPLVLTQNGTTVKYSNRDYQITPAGTFGWHQFSVHDDKSGHDVATASQADLVYTNTFRLEGSTMVEETTFDYRNQNFNHPPGKEVLVISYRRIAP